MLNAHTLGIDAGSSGIKVSFLHQESNTQSSASLFPNSGQELEISRPHKDYAEQDPKIWWENLVLATKDGMQQGAIGAEQVAAIGIAYQMHGLVLVDKEGEIIRPSIIWCDSRAVEIGAEAFKKIGAEWSLENLLNSPGNFTFSKLAWVKKHEPENYARIHKIMLPGDYLAYRLTGEIKTTISGLSEGIFWNFKERSIAGKLLEAYGISINLLPEITDTFGVQGKLTQAAAKELGLKAGIPVTYRAGDQPNNALSLKVLEQGEVATTAGTSAVIYGVSEKSLADPKSRVNTFVHVNNNPRETKNGVLLCINGAGSAYSWLRQTFGAGRLSYAEMDQQAETSTIGANGIIFLPFGNGSERMLENRILDGSFVELNFGRNQADIFRAGLEGIAFAMNYGLEVMRGTGVNPEVIRAGKANMFQSRLFREIFTCVTGARLELCNTDGAQGAARGAAIGAGLYDSTNEAFAGLKVLDVIAPDSTKVKLYAAAYQRWKTELERRLAQKD